MAYFECILGGAIGLNIPLVVTCAIDFAGLDITCTDGTTTLTQPCPSSSPYEVSFLLPNTGTWTISGTINGITYTESVLVENFDVELTDIIDITVDVYSAASDTVSYVGLDNQTHTITTDANGHANATITIIDGSVFTFTSSVADDPNNLSNRYSKQITLKINTTSIYVMPDKAVYWYGNKVNSESRTSANGYPVSSGWTVVTPTYNTRSASISTQFMYTGGIGTRTPVEGTTLKAIVNGTSYVSSAYPYYYTLTINNAKTGATIKNSGQITQSGKRLSSLSVAETINAYANVFNENGNASTIHALWIE